MGYPPFLIQQFTPMEVINMSAERAKRIRQLIAFAVSISLIVAGICLMAACYGIYTSGDRPFSREAVAAAFEPIALPVLLSIALVLISLVADLLLPAPVDKPKFPRQYTQILLRLQNKTDLSKCPEDLSSQILVQRKLRKNLNRICLFLTAVCSGLFLIYGLNSNNFHQSEINASMVSAMARLIPAMAVPFAFGIFSAYKAGKSMDVEIGLLRQAPKEATMEAQIGCNCGCSAATKIRRGILLIAIVILVYGCYAGGTADVLTKAINICTECVGLG